MMITNTETLTLVIGAVQAVGTVVAVVALFLTNRQLRDNTRWNRLNAALGYLDPRRLAEAERLAFAAIASMAHDFSDPSTSLARDEATAIIGDPATYVPVKHFLNLLEASAAAIKVGAVDDEFAYSQLGYYLPRCLDYFREVILVARERKGNPECWYEIEHLSGQWASRKAREKHGGYLQKKYG